MNLWQYQQRAEPVRSTIGEADTFAAISAEPQQPWRAHAIGRLRRAALAVAAPFFFFVQVPAPPPAPPLEAFAPQASAIQRKAPPARAHLIRAFSFQEDQLVAPTVPLPVPAVPADLRRALPSRAHLRAGLSWPGTLPENGLSWLHQQPRPVRRTTSTAYLNESFNWRDAPVVPPPPWTDQPPQAVSQPVPALADRTHLGEGFAWKDAPAPPAWSDQPIVIGIEPRRRISIPVASQKAFFAPDRKPVCPGGVTKVATTLYVQNDACALDGLAYTPAEINLSFPTDEVDLAQSIPSFQAKTDIQVGDLTTASEHTTIAFPKGVVTWDSGKTLKTRLTQLSSWEVKTGTKGTAPNGKASGKDGATLNLGATTTLRGNQRMYGAHLRCLSGTLSIFSQAGGGLTNEWINCMLEGIGTINLGSATLGQMSYVYDVSIMSSTTGTVMANFVCDYAEKVIIFCQTPNRFISTGSVVRVRDLELVGFPVDCDVANTGVSEWDLVGIIWSQNARQTTLAVGRINIWDVWRPKVINPLDGMGRAGISVEMFAADGTPLISAVTDALGNIAFGAPGSIYVNAVKIAHWTSPLGFPTFTELGPFRIVVNGINTDPSLAVLDYYADWLHTTYVVGGITFKQFLPMGGAIPLGPPPEPTVAPSPPAPMLVEDLPLPAENVQRILTPVSARIDE